MIVKSNNSPSAERNLVKLVKQITPVRFKTWWLLTGPLILPKSVQSQQALERTAALFPSSGNMRNQTK